ncbi:hypothetical protein GCM10007424_13410 [Flavobacterium suaedae]|uniref:DUF4825 domain-containing protein n=1 Tax=Flavobacterium suaedae TaxID=1767027 RepID=A0ABQ1JQ34_9FLAO|nr:hypothetical protein [Flavobacterium suaedae]GGB74770.1 hypothetical protein GCM10007424_13410 [Flavobacterium suaedae]
MKIIVKGALLVVLSLGMVNCKKTQDPPKEKYCGIEMTGFEVMDSKTIAKKGYNHTSDDKELAGDMMAAIDSMSGKAYDVNFSFFMRDNEKIGLYVLGPNDQKEIEKISCLLLKEDFDGRLPEERELLFYTNDHNTLLAAVKSKSEEVGEE